MIRNILRPCFSQSILGTIRSYATVVDKASLSKLRKKTGIGFMNCRKALEQFDNDIDKAEKWLLEQAQKEGWAKATKLQGRPMSQGLIGVMSDNQRATVVEINCETDFVAKNENFQGLVSQVTSGCHRYFMAAPSSTQVSFAKDKLDAVDIGDNQNVSDLVAMMVGKVGENLSARRVTHVGVEPNSYLETYIHATGADIEVDGCRMGKYAVLLDVSQDVDGSEVNSIQTVSKQLCQHILGLKPSVVGDFENDKPVSNTDENKSPADSDQTSDESDTSDSDDSGNESDSDSDDEEKPVKPEETRLVFQEFLFDPEMVVGEYIKENGVTVNKFVRIECGEVIPEKNQ